MSDKKEELPAFEMKGKINYEIKLASDSFEFRTQVSHENNLCALLQSKEIFGHLIEVKSNPTIPKNQRISQKEMQNIKTAYRMLEYYATQLAGAVYDLTLKEHQKPKLEIVKEGEMVAKALKDKGIV